MKVTIGVSNRHVHLKEEDIRFLFGEELIKDRDLVQTGEYASLMRVDLKTDKGIIKNVRVLGPKRSYSQVEISKTDSYKLGLKPPVRKSGDLKGSESITLIGPNGELKLDEACIIANRHIHMNYEMANKLGYKDDDLVKVKINSIKGGIFDNVYIKVTENGVYELHIDTDDANAFFVDKTIEGEIINGN